MSWQMESGSSPVPGGTSMTSRSRSPQLTSSMNWRIAPIFSGPRHTTGLSALSSRKPTDMTLRPPICTGSMPSSSPARRRPSRPSIVGTLGPCRSTSSRPTRRPDIMAAMAMFTATVLLPTPPLPDMTMIFFWMRPRRALSFASSCPGAAWRGPACSGLGWGFACCAEEQPEAEQELQWLGSQPSEGVWVSSFMMGRSWGWLSQVEGCRSCLNGGVSNSQDRDGDA